MKISTFEDLEIWIEARELCKSINKLTQRDSFSRDFKLKDQIRSASGSIMDNIAEGFERGGNKEFIQFLYIAKGSCGEVRSQSYRSFDFNYITEDDFSSLIEKTTLLSKKINSFINYLQKSNFKGAKYH